MLHLCHVVIAYTLGFVFLLFEENRVLCYHTKCKLFASVIYSMRKSFFKSENLCMLNYASDCLFTFIFLRL